MLTSMHPFPLTLQVTIIGDGTDAPMPLEGASLTDKDTVISLGCSIPLPQPISEVRRCLSDKVFR